MQALAVMLEDRVKMGAVGEGEMVEDSVPPPPPFKGGEAEEVFVGPPCKGLAAVGVGPPPPPGVPVRVGVERGAEGVGAWGVGVGDIPPLPPVG